MNSKKILVTGAAGFIGSALATYIIENTDAEVICVDSLSYAGNQASLSPIEHHPNYNFEQADICEAERMTEIFAKHQPDSVMHLAAESHVDKSIDGPEDFIQSNIVGTFRLLDVARNYWQEKGRSESFRFLHVSTDEVYGSLGPEGLFSETTPYDPRSPYSASKAASDHLAMAWFHTYDFPVLITNCSNNYGPRQFPEKLVPTVILKALAGDSIPVYGDGGAVRDWLYVDDHVRGLLGVLEKGRLGETYNIGTNNEKTTVEMVEAICSQLDELLPSETLDGYKVLMKFVQDRPGHDRRYAIDASKIRSELGWEPLESFDTGMKKTVQWYLDNRKWCDDITSGVYRLERQGLAT